MSLKSFVENENRMSVYFKKPMIDIENITDDQAQSMFSRLDSNLSPEFLHADGERTKAQANKVYKETVKAYKELISKGFAPSITLYNVDF